MYEKQIATAQRLIKKFGQSVTWRILQNVVDPAKPWNVTELPGIDKTVHICFLPTDRAGFESLGLKRPADLPTTAVLALMGAVDFAPTLKDVVIRNGQMLTIDYIDILAPNGKPILYTMILK